MRSLSKRENIAFSEQSDIKDSSNNCNEYIENPQRNMQ